jgi:hypothetical protein
MQAAFALPRCHPREGGDPCLFSPYFPKMDSRLRGNDAVAGRKDGVPHLFLLFRAYAASVRTEHAGASVFATNANKNDKRHAWMHGMAYLCGWKKGGHAGPLLRYTTLKSIAIPAPTIHRHTIRQRRRFASNASPEIHPYRRGAPTIHHPGIRPCRRLTQKRIARNPPNSSGRQNDTSSRNPPIP